MTIASAKDTCDRTCSVCLCWLKLLFYLATSIYRTSGTPRTLLTILILYYALLLNTRLSTVMTINRNPSTSSSKTTTTNHQSMQQSREDLKRYLPWALDQQETEHVSFTSFVEKFKLSHCSRAVGAYEALITSTQLKALRRRELSASFKTFKEHNLRSYWLNYKLRSERAVTKINLDIAATKTARIVQDASIGETLKAAGLSESRSNYSSSMLSVSMS